MRTLATTSVLLLMTGCGGCKDAEDEAPVVYDDPSSLTIESPAEGAWLADGAVTVSGQTENVDSVTVNGEAAALSEDGSYSTAVTLSRGINVIDVVGIELDGDALNERRSVIAGDFADPGYEVEDGIQLRLNQGGINEMTDMIETMVSAKEVTKSLGEDINPVFTTDEVLWTWAAADLEGIDFGAVEITAAPEQMIELEVVLPDLVVDIYAYGEVTAIDFTQDVSMTAEKVVITAKIEPGAVDGTLTVALLDPEVDLQGFAYDTSLLPSFMEDYFFVETIQETIEETLVEQMEEMVPELLDEQLEALDFSFETEVMESTVSATRRVLPIPGGP